MLQFPVQNFLIGRKVLTVINKARLIANVLQEALCKNPVKPEGAVRKRA